MIDVLGSRNPMKAKKMTQDWIYKNNSVILIKVRFELYQRPFDLKTFFPGADLTSHEDPHTTFFCTPHDASVVKGARF